MHTSWGNQLWSRWRRNGLLRINLCLPRSTGLEDHSQIIKTEISDFNHQEITIDSLLCTLQGVVALMPFRQFVIKPYGPPPKKEKIAGFFQRNTSEEFHLVVNSITDSHITTITDTILLLQ